jgi:diguanylate cyclase (GGDEF)-like protein
MSQHHPDHRDHPGRPGRSSAASQAPPAAAPHQRRADLARPAASRVRFFQAGLVLAFLIWSLLRDRRRRRAHQAELALAWLQSRTDPLTGLANRAEVQDRLTGNGYPCPVVMLALLDLDGFKEVNDTYGHDVGDDLLTVIAERLIHATTNHRDVDGRIVPARLGGDEFVLLWLRIPPDPVGHVERILREITAPVHVAGDRWPLGISAGVALAGPHLHGPGLLRAADAAMYRAKKYTHPGTTETGSPATSSGHDDGRAGGSVRVRLWTDERPPVRPQHGPGPAPGRRAERDNPHPTTPTPSRPSR